MMENLLATKRKKPTKDQWNLSRRGKLAPPPEDHIGGQKVGPQWLVLGTPKSSSPC